MEENARRKLIEQYEWNDTLERLRATTIEAKRLEDTTKFNRRANELLLSRAENVLDSLSRATNELDRRIDDLRTTVRNEIIRRRNTNSTSESRQKQQQQ